MTMADVVALPLRGTSAARGPLLRWRRSRAWQRFARNRLAVVCALFLVALTAVILLAPLVLPSGPEEGNLLESLEGPSLAHPLGTDTNGRDILTRLLYGGRVSLSVGLVAVTLSLLLGTVIGALSGFYGGWVDAVLMRLTEAMLSLPTFFLVLAILAVFPGGGAVAVVIGLTSWMPIARVVRGEFLRWKATEFVEAAHVIGSSDARIIVRHVLPQALPAIIVAATLGVAFAILTESAISYLGLGIQPPTPTWGNMLLEAQQYVWQNPLLAVYPGLMILLTVTCFNAIGDGLRDALDPRMSDR
jgi:peptide/nickel transport system permease protein